MHDRMFGISLRPIWIYSVWIFMTLLLCNLDISVAQSSEPESFDLAIEGRGIAGNVKSIRVTQGSQVVVRWSSDEVAELHLHGYDVKTKIVPGTVAEMRFEAHATGRYPVTVHGFGEKPGGHGHHKTLLHIEIYPK